MTAMTPEQFLSGGGQPAAKFETPGTTVGGRIVNPPTVSQQTDFKTREPVFWPSGDPKMQLLVDVQTDRRDPAIEDDDGIRRIYVKGKSLTNAVRDAVRDAGVKGIEVGGTLTVTYVQDGIPAERTLSAPKEYTATYSPPSTTAATSTFLGTDTPAAAAPAQNGAPGGLQLTPELAAALAALQKQQQPTG